MPISLIETVFAADWKASSIDRSPRARCPGFADRLEDFLNQLELIGGKGVVLDEIFAILELPKRHPAVLEGELVLEDVALGLELGFEVTLHVR